MICSTHRSSPAFAIGRVEHAFACIVCGADVAMTRFLEERGICPQHCFEHNFEYDSYERDWPCSECGERPSRDWYYVDE